MAKSTPFAVVWLGFFIRCTSCPAITHVAAVHAVGAVQIVHAASAVMGGTHTHTPVHWGAFDAPTAGIGDAAGTEAEGEGSEGRRVGTECGSGGRSRWWR